MRAHRTPHELLDQALEWVRETGWPSRGEDTAIADRVYKSWIVQTNAEWTTTHSRDREKLSEAIEAAFRPIRDDRAADCIYVILMSELELRARRDGMLCQGRDH